MHLFAGLSSDHAVISDFAMGLVDVTDDGSPALGIMLVIKNDGEMLYLDPIDPQCFKKIADVRKADSGTYKWKLFPNHPDMAVYVDGGKRAVSDRDLTTSVNCEPRTTVLENSKAEASRQASEYLRYGFFPILGMFRKLMTIHPNHSVLVLFQLRDVPSYEHRQDRPH
jgi:hypothetical protein